MAIETSRLLLIPSSPNVLVTLIDDPDSLEIVTGFRQASGLRDFFVSGEVSPAWLNTLRDAQSADPWRFGFLVVERESGLIIGSGGYKGPPDRAGTVEIAYGVVPDFEGQGFASEIAKALVTYAFQTSEVRLVRAHTLPETSASTRVLEKCGFHYVGPVEDDDDGSVWRWELPVRQ